MIQSHALQDRIRREHPDDHTHNQPQDPPRHSREQPVLRRLASSKEQMNKLGRIRRKIKRKKRRIEPLQIIPTSMEEAPLRRQDQRTINAISRRKGDKHLILCITFSAFVFLTIGISSIYIWFIYRSEFVVVGPLIVVGPVIGATGIFLLLALVEIVARLNHNTKRVMDKDLFQVENLHEVKHWVEPVLIGFGWGQFNVEEEAKLLDENRLRKEKPPLERYV